MDPNYFHLDYAKLVEILLTIIVLSFLVERALALLFESRFFIYLTESGNVVIKMKEERGETIDDATRKKLEKRKKKSLVKETIALIVSIIACYLCRFDAFTILFVTSEKMTVVGYILTGAIIAGGSKASIALFKNVMDVMSSGEEARRAAKNNK
jgi:hypothetical protein